MNKRGQLTIFMIIGLIILVAGGVIISTQEQSVKDLATKAEQQIQNIPFEFQPAYEFVQECIEQTAREGLNKLGERAGYINPLEQGLITRDEATEADAVPMAPGSSYSIPYWWYLSSANDCSDNCQFTMVPQQKLFLKKNGNQVSIEGQLEEYIRKETKTCLNNFEVLKSQGFNVEENDDLAPEVNIINGEIIILSDYPLTFSRAGQRVVDAYLVRLDIDLPTIYNAAKTLAETEADLQFIEKHLLNLMTAFSGLDRNKLPPFSDTRAAFQQEVTWQKRDVEKNFINNVATPNIALLKVFGTRNYQPYPFHTDPLLDALYNRGMLIPGTSNYSNLDIELEYNPFWNMYFNIDCDDTCGPESFHETFLTGLLLQSYDFVYDISIPVKVTITDSEAFKGQGFTFSYFIEANIRQNQPLLSDYVRTEGAQVVGESLFCDEDKRNSGEIEVIVTDEITGEPIEDARVLISTATESCFVGETTQGTMTEHFPVAFGAIMTVSKEDYLSKSARIETRLNKEAKYEISLAPRLEKQIVIKKRLLQRNRGSTNWFIGPTANLTEGEEAIVILRRLSPITEQSFTTTAEYKALQSPQDIEIAPGTYEVEVMLLDNRNISIPDRQRRIKGNSFNLPGLELGDGAKTGGALFNFTFTKNNLNKDPLVFYALNPDIFSIPEDDRNLEDINTMQSVNERSKRYWEKLTQDLR